MEGDLSVLNGDSRKRGALNAGKQACPVLCSLEGGRPLRTIHMLALARLADVTKHSLVLTTRSICSLTPCDVGDT